MPQAVLQMAEGEGAEDGGDVDHGDEGDDLGQREAHRLLRVDPGERHDRLDPGLIENDADQESAHVHVVPGVAQALAKPGEGPGECPSRDRTASWRGALPQQQEGRKGGRGEQEGGDHERHGHGRLVGDAVGLGPGEPAQRERETHEPTDVAERPTPARHPAEPVRTREFRQERGDESLAAAEEVVGDDHEDEREHDVARPRERERGGGGDAPDRGREQEPFLRGVGVGPGAERWGGRHDEGVGDREGAGPGQGRPLRIAGDARDEPGVEYGRDDDGRVAGVGEIVHGPGPDLPAAHAGGKGRGEARVRGGAHRGRFRVDRSRGPGARAGPGP